MLVKKILSKRNRSLLRELVATDFKLRYQGSVVGYAWSLLRPLLIFMILYLVFVKFLKLGQNMQHFPVYLLLGIVLWNFFTEMTNQSLRSVVDRGELVRKIRIPRWIIVVSSSLSSLINLALNLIVVGIFMVINQVDITRSILFLPLIIFEIYVFALGVSFLLASLFVKYRDTSYIWEVLIQAGFYVTPILYPLTLITNPDLQKLLLLNPIAQAIQDARYAVITPETLTAHALFGGTFLALVPFAIIGIMLAVGVYYFKKESKYFAENI